MSKILGQTVDRYGNVTQTQVYDWNATSASWTYTNTWQHGADGATLSGLAQTYDQNYIRNRLLTSQTPNGSSTESLVSNTWGGSGQYGLLMGSITPSATSSYTYDGYGNMTGTTVNGLTTNVTMDTTHNSIVPSLIQTGSNSQAIEWNTFLGLTQNTGQNGDTAQIGYDSVGRPSSATSPYGAVTNYAYGNYYSASSPATITATTNSHFTRQTLDGLGRTIKTESGTVSGSTYTTVSQTETQYAPCGCSPLGKVSAVSAPHTPTGTVYWTNYSYDWQGRTTLVVLPDGSTTTYVYDDYNPASDPTPASFVRVTDAAAKQKRFQVNGIDRLRVVTEDPAGLALTTSYSYDVLGHLAQVTQTRTPYGGGNPVTQTRTFNYANSSGTVTGYLQSANNPENGTVTYTYNSNWTLASKKDNAGNTTTYTYDSQNRLLTDSAGYTYTWDSGTGSNLLGRIAQISYGLSPGKTTITETYGYTASGEVSSKTMSVNHPYTYGAQNQYQGTMSLPLALTWAYDSEGHRTQMIYPVSYNTGGAPQAQNSTLAYSYDQMERPVSLTDTGSNTVLANGVSWNAANQIAQMTYLPAGAAAVDTRAYNTLMQLTGKVVGNASTTYQNMSWGYTAGQNNGQITTQTNALSGETVSYLYDTLKRLSSATAGSWEQSFVYDGFGNLLQKNATKGSAPAIAMTVNAANNQITMVGSSSCGYDANGDMLYGPTLNNGWADPLTYDFRNRVTSYRSGTTTMEYGYDASNRRVWKAALSGGAIRSETYYLYDLDGTQLASYGLKITQGQNTQVLALTVVTSHLYLAGTEVASYSLFGYGLPTTVEGVAAEPGLQDRIGSRGKFYPYGEEESATLNETFKFATYWRDGESGLDYAGNRYYSSSMGRFLSADPYNGSMDPANPGSFNRYAYVVGDPVNRNDPKGLFLDDDEGDDDGDGGGGGGGGDLGGTNGGDVNTGAACATGATWCITEDSPPVPDPSPAPDPGPAPDPAPPDPMPQQPVGPPTVSKPKPQRRKKLPPCNDANYDRSRFFQQLPGITSVAQQLDVPVNFLVGLSSYESGWLDDHNFALNNLWGLTNAGGNNLSFTSIQVGNAYFVGQVAPFIQGDSTIQLFLSGLQKEGYNAINPSYYTTLTNRIDNIPKWEAACGVNQ